MQSNANAASAFALLLVAVLVVTTSMASPVIPDSAVNILRVKPTVQFEDKTYYIYETALTWTAADSFCKSTGKTLVAIESQPELDYLKNAFIDNDQFYWTSGRSRFMPLELHDWTVTGQRFNFNLRSYGSIDAGGTSCIGFGGYMDFQVAECSQIKPFICQAK